MTFARWTLAALLTGAAVGAIIASGTSPAAAKDDAAEAARVAKAELAKAVARGEELFRSGDLGRKSCQDCHDDPDEPQDALAGRAFSYPAYSRRARRVVTLQQKINEMIKYKVRGQALDAGGADIAAIAAYVSSIKKR